MNHFRVSYQESTIFHYDISIKIDQASSEASGKELSKAELLSVKDELFRDNDLRSLLSYVAYDGARNLFTSAELPRRTFRVKDRSRTYIVSADLKKHLPLSQLSEIPVPRDILQGLDVIVREASAPGKIILGRGFYSPIISGRTRLCAALLEGTQQTLKYTQQGLILCADYSVMPFYKAGPVLDGVRKLVGRLNCRTSLPKHELKGRCVAVIHRRTNQKYMVQGLN